MRKAAKRAARYLAWLFASGVAVLATVGMALYYQHRAGLLPPFPLTGSISFDEKAGFVRHALRQNYDLVAAGSSMTLNDLSSDVLTAQMPAHPRVLNIAAWSMTVSDTRRWLRLVLAHSKPKTVILIMGSMDFYPGDLWFARVSDEEMEAYLSGGFFAPFVLARKFSLEYYAANWRSMRGYRASRATYHSLRFDSGGAVPMDVYYPRIDPARWNEVTQVAWLTDAQYHELGLLAKELRSRHIDLIGVRAPMRPRALAIGGTMLDRHWHRVEEALTTNGQSLIDITGELNFDDSCFADYSHLNASGVWVFTAALAKRLSGGV